MNRAKVIHLRDLKSNPVAVTIKINDEVLQHFKNLKAKGKSPKLIVKNGDYSIKIHDNLSFPCFTIPEYSNFDIYQECSDGYEFGGQVTKKLTILTDPKQIRQHEKRVVTNTNSNNHSNNNAAVTGPKLKHDIKPHGTSLSTPTSPLNFDPYLYSFSDSKSDITSKFLAFMALGPTTKDNLVTHLKFPSKDLDNLLAVHCQKYNPNDNFISDDFYPNNLKLVDDNNHYILKDKSYKELRPWEWTYYSINERSLIINNIHNALTRSGYLVTHPLRKKICEEPISRHKSTDTKDGNEKEPKKPALGGGFLISKKTSPVRKSQTESPKLTPQLDKDTSKSNISPLRRTQNGSGSESDSKKRQLSSTSLSGSSDDEIKRMRFNKDDYTSPSSVNEDDIDDDDMENVKKNQYYHNLQIKFRLKYKDYEILYHSLKSQRITDLNEIRKKLTNLYEIHNNLAEWKKQLWDMDKGIKDRENIMNLSKHKKSNSSNNSAASTPTLRPNSPASGKSHSFNSKSKPTNKRRVVLNY